MSILDKIKLVQFSPSQYINEAAPKRQIYIHHTASSPNPYNVIRWWETTPERIATAFVIGGHPGNSTEWTDGCILQTFSSSKWGWHLGLSSKHLKAGGKGAWSNKELNRQSIGIEICNWGYLTQTPRGFTNYTGKIVPDNDVVELDTKYRGYKYYQRYTTMQLENTSELLKFLCNRWDIPTQFKGIGMFDISPAALRGEPGIWTHTSVRPDKFDCFPQKELISMLSSL